MASNSLRVKRRRAGRPSKRARPRSRFAPLRGARNSGATTDQILNSLRGYAEDADDPGFKGLKASVARLPHVKHAQVTRYKRRGRA